jgi:uncharacterized protein
MTPELIVDNLLNPPVLFFLLGVIAATVRSDLELPHPIPKLLSLYLLLSIGLRGGVELSHGGLSQHVVIVLLACIIMAIAVPIWSYFILRIRMDVNNAAAIAATYGSVSAVTFIIATDFLHLRGEAFGGHMVAALALMESPAIIVGILLARRFDPETVSAVRSARHGWGAIGREAFLNGAVLLLLGSIAIGLVSDDRQFEKLQPFVVDPFTGVLCLFLLDMGLVAARRMSGLFSAGVFLISFAIAAPIVHALIGIVLAKIIGMSAGDALLFAILCGSASYIAVPAAIRLALPKSNPGIFVPMALGITFPFNVTLGIPLYMAIIEAWNIGAT